MVGVFVDEKAEIVQQCLEQGWIEYAQLHGHESQRYVKEIQKVGKVIQAFQIRTQADMNLAIQSCADYILLDQGKGSGQSFDWSLLENLSRPFFLAGGIDEKNIIQTQKYHPYALDVSSAVETNRCKDKNKVEEIIRKGRTI